MYNTYTLSKTAVVTAIICILAPISLPIGAIPISLTNFAIYISIYILGWKQATISCLLYIFMGTIGLPVFSGFSGGIAKLLGPTGGYIVGFIAIVIFSGIIVEKSKSIYIHFLAFVFGTIICYTFGTIWFCFQSNSTLLAALSICVFPFIPFDFSKIIISIIIGPSICKRLIKADIK